MRWLHNHTPKEGAVRIKDKFVIWPRCLKHHTTGPLEWRCCELAKIRQVYKKVPAFDWFWLNLKNWDCKWVNECWAN